MGISEILFSSVKGDSTDHLLDEDLMGKQSKIENEVAE